MATMLYLYGVVPEDAPEPEVELRGLDDGAVRLVHAGGVAAIVSELSGEEYADDVLDERLAELGWVGERGLAHERVLDWFAERGPVVPLSLFSLHADEQRVRERLEGDAERLRELLERLRGRREWGVKLWRHEARVAEHLDELSPTLQAMARELASAAPGRRYLLGKKREELRAEELRRISGRVAHQVLALLSEQADQTATIPPPPAQPGGDRALALSAAFLVVDERFADFQRRLSELAREFTPHGFEFEFTGPWPPYHFVEPDGR